MAISWPGASGSTLPRWSEPWLKSCIRKRCRRRNVSVDKTSLGASADGLQGTLERTFTGIAHSRETLTPQLLPREVGTLTSVSTGIARVSGLPKVGYEEVVKFSGDLYGIAFNVDEEEVGVVLLGDYWQLHTGEEVERRGHVMDVPVGDR